MQFPLYKLSQNPKPRLSYTGSLCRGSSRQATEGETFSLFFSLPPSSSFADSRGRLSLQSLWDCVLVLLSIFFAHRHSLYRTTRLSRGFRYTIKIHPHSGWYFLFGHSPNNTGCAQVRFLLACQPCNCYLLPINGSRGSNIANWSLSLSCFN